MFNRLIIFNLVMVKGSKIELNEINFLEEIKNED